MLKIKDNIDLKELEKFGFKYVEDKSFEGDFSYCEKQIGGNVVLGVAARNRILYPDITNAESNITYIFSDGLDVLFDLFQEGIVEKVARINKGE